MRNPLALGLAWTLGCTPAPLCVSAMDASATALSVKLARGKSCDQPVEVEEVIVRRASDRAILWRFRAGGGVKLSAFTYGVVPEGCTGPTAEALVPGEPVVVEVEDVFGADGVGKLTPR